MYKINPFARVISTKWCYKRKPDRYKARVVARGFLQSPWDVGETHSNVAKLSSVRALLSKAAVSDYSIRQVDIGNAYLCADIASEHVFCSPPEGREKPGYVMYLQKALYGLKNSAKAWFDTFATYLKSLGYSPRAWIKVPKVPGTVVCVCVLLGPPRGTPGHRRFRGGSGGHPPCPGVA
jgi:hypothetical protein